MKWDNGCWENEEEEEEEGEEDTAAVLTSQRYT